MDFVTDRTKQDVMLGTEKGKYTVSDLNRVENNVAELAKILTESGVLYEPSVSVWSIKKIPTNQEMARYLGNVRKLCELAEVSVQLPESMAQLTWDGANQIELALFEVYKKLAQKKPFYF